MTVLYVDDDSDDREIFGSAIHVVSPGVSYHEFEAGQKIIDYLRSEEVKPDYIFIDINMPKMNGYECANAILSNFGVDHSRIVMFSTSFNPTDLARFHKMGVHTLQKSPTFNELIQNLRNLIAGNPTELVINLRVGSR